MVGLTGTALAPRRRHTSRSVIIVGWRGLGGASQLPQPHLKDGSVYRPLRPTKLDKIEPFFAEVQLGAVSGKPDTECEVCSASAYSHLNSRALAATQTAAIAPR